MMCFQRFPANFGFEPRKADMGGCRQVVDRQMDNHSPAPSGCFSVQRLSPFDRKCRRTLYSKCFISRALAEEGQRCRPDEKGIETLLFGSYLAMSPCSAAAPMRRGLKHAVFDHETSEIEMPRQRCRPDEKGIETRRTSRCLLR
jgi:hypothetical protein